MKNSLNKKIIPELLISIFLFLSFLLVFFIWERTRDPLAAIDQYDPDIFLLGENSYLSGKRIYSEIELLSTNSDTVKAIISFPKNYRDKRSPVITILGGINIGIENLRFIKEPGGNILVIFLYAYNIEQWEKGWIVREVQQIRKDALKTPAQIVELQHWILQQSWTDTQRIATVGYSFGSFFLPAAQHLAQKYNVSSGSTVIAYGGADFDILINENLRTKPKWFRPVIAYLAASLLHTVDPLNHASFMRGNFYLINGVRDKQIPMESWQLLHDLTPQPKKIDLLDEGHMHPEKEYLTEKLIEMSRAWLQQKGVMK